MGRYYTKKQLAVRLTIIGIIVVAVIAAVVFHHKREPERREINVATGAFIRKEHAVYRYTGKPIRPQLQVFASGDPSHPLKKTDYTISYRNNTKIGTATITVTGKGLKYGGTGSMTDHFRIVGNTPDYLDQALYRIAYSDTTLSGDEANTAVAEAIIGLGKEKSPQEIKVRAQNFRKSLPDSTAEHFYNAWNEVASEIDGVTASGLQYASYGVPKAEVSASVKAFKGPYFKKNWKTLKKFLPTNIPVSSASDLKMADKKTFQAAV